MNEKNEKNEKIINENDYKNEKIINNANNKINREYHLQNNKPNTVTAFNEPVTYEAFQKFISSGAGRSQKKICKKITRVYYNNNLIDMYDCLCYAVPAFEETDIVRSYDNWEDFVGHYGKYNNARSCRMYLKGIYEWVRVWRRKFKSWRVTVEYRSVGSSVNRHRSCDDKEKVSMQRILNELSEEEFVEYWKDNFDQTTRFLSKGGNE